MNQPRANNLSRWAIVLLVLAVLVTGAIALYTSEHKQEEAVVRVVSPRFEDIAKTVTTNGKVTPIDDFQARANFPGIVENVYVEVGDQIKPGQILVKMKDPFAVSRVATADSALKAAQNGRQNIERGGSQEERIAFAGDLEHAQQTQRNAASSLAALQQLQERGAASAGEVDAARQRLLSANTTLEATSERSTRRFSAGDMIGATARVADASASLDAAKVAFANANITAPQAGTVYSVLVSNYDFVPMGAELLHVADLNKMQIRAFFDEPDIGQLTAGQPVKVVWEARPDKVWHGHMRRAPLAAMVLGTRNVAEGIITLDDARGDLLPNTNVIVSVTVEHRERVLTIPRTALVTSGQDSFAYRVVDGKLKKTPVMVGIINLDRVEIVNGLSPGDKIAANTTDVRILTDNLPIKPVE